jgi:hypothetical protein
MARILLIATLIILWTVAPSVAEPAGKKLIPVYASYHEAAYVPQKAEALDDLPTPRDQMYVFWILGRVLSYPFDKAEEYVDSFKNRRKVQAVPATAPARSKGPNPFMSSNWREIPPAPPVNEHGR